MKRLSFVLLTAFIIGCSGSGVGIIEPVKSQALQGITGVDALMGVACIANYQRVAPHICQRTILPSASNFTHDDTCRSFSVTTAYSIPTSSNLVILHVIRLTGTGLINIYTDSGCTNNTDRMFTVAQADRLMVPITGGVFYYTAAAGSTSSFYPVQYYD